MHFKSYKRIVQPKGHMNLTRGCIHGCIYCDSRSTCYQMDHEFTDIEIKQNACEMLETELSNKKKRFMLSTGGMSDPYMNLEPVLKLTRCCFETIYKYGFGLSFLTKSTLFLNDMDLLEKIHKRTKMVVQMTITTYDDQLCKIIEPGIEVSSKRIDALKVCQSKGIPTIVWISPLLPMINDTLENIVGVLDQCLTAGVKGIVWFGAGLTLRDGDRQYYYQKLDEHFPGLKEKYIKYYGERYELPSFNHKKINQYVIDFCKKHHLMYQPEEVFKYLHTFETNGQVQLSLF